jgi:hypothetical protein
MTEKTKEQQPRRYSKDGKQIVASLNFGNNTLVGDVTNDTSVGIPVWILTHDTLSSRAVRLWAYLRGALNGSLSIPGTSHRSISTLLDVSDSTAERTIYELRDAGALQIVHSFSNGRQVGNIYYLWPTLPVGNGSSPVGRGVLTSEEGYINTNINIISPTVDTKKSTPRKPRASYPDVFEEMWKFYPRHDAKSGAFEKYSATIKRGVEPALLLLAVQNYALTRKGEDPAYTIYAQTFFGHTERWREFVGGTESNTVEVELTDEQRALAFIYDAYDAGNEWFDPKSGESRFDNPAKYGYTRSVNSKGELLAGDGTTYALDAQGVRRSGSYWLK